MNPALATVSPSPWPAEPANSPPLSQVPFGVTPSVVQSALAPHQLRSPWSGKSALRFFPISTGSTSRWTTFA